MNKPLTFVILALFSCNTWADSFRCGGDVVKSGDSINKLSNKCGNPQRTYNTYETMNDHGRRYQVSVSNWVYVHNGQKDMIVSVRDNVVIKIKPD